MIRVIGCKFLLVCPNKRIIIKTSFSVILIGVLGVHLIFWVVIVLCRTMLSGMFSRVSTRYMNGVRTLFGCQSSTSNPVSFRLS